MGIIEVWTMIAVVLHYCEVGFFADWPVVALPWHWSCFCLFIWEWGICGIIFAAYCLYQWIDYMIFVHKGNKETENDKKDFINDPFYVEVNTGKYFFRSELIKKYGREGLGELVSRGIFEHEARYEKNKKEADNGND